MNFKEKKNSSDTGKFKPGSVAVYEGDAFEFVDHNDEDFLSKKSPEDVVYEGMAVLKDDFGSYRIVCEYGLLTFAEFNELVQATELAS